MVPVWINYVGLSSKVPAWKSRETGLFYTWTSKELLSAQYIVKCWNQEPELQKNLVSHEFTDADKIRAHSWGVAL
jgi:hypothetical protein